MFEGGRKFERERERKDLARERVEDEIGEKGMKGLSKRERGKGVKEREGEELCLEKGRRERKGYVFLI